MAAGSKENVNCGVCVNKVTKRTGGIYFYKNLLRSNYIYTSNFNVILTLFTHIGQIYSNYWA